MSDAALQVKVGDTWYRFADRRVGSFDSDGDHLSSHVELRCQTYTVRKVTAKGVWLVSSIYREDRFVLLGAQKRFAHPTKEAALESLIARKSRQIRILEGQAANARAAVALAEMQLNRPRSTPVLAVEYMAPCGAHV